ncbi:hypothetical protein RchiOBHm_Chr5g0058911 [Rosa chinensis]|uniref:Uncharacterized protein n=1 Tax=Rosa chinensis TaxID=74649 RepID=A0A2P6QHA1_ROSCH|nr:hypothetical protein RchiOBHm_Chr5g0058911 [Rosa chinensis]
MSFVYVAPCHTRSQPTHINAYNPKGATSFSHGLTLISLSHLSFSLSSLTIFHKN